MFLAVGQGYSLELKAKARKQSTLLLSAPCFPRPHGRLARPSPPFFYRLPRPSIHPLHHTLLFFTYKTYETPRGTSTKLHILLHLAAPPPQNPNPSPHQNSPSPAQDHLLSIAPLPRPPLTPSPPPPSLYPHPASHVCILFKRASSLTVSIALCSPRVSLPISTNRLASRLSGDPLQDSFRLGIVALFERGYKATCLTQKHLIVHGVVPFQYAVELV